MIILKLALLGSLRIALLGSLKVALFLYTLSLSDKSVTGRVPEGNGDYGDPKQWQCGRRVSGN
jgi:hypothetical protein